MAVHPVDPAEHKSIGPDLAPHVDTAAYAKMRTTTNPNTQRGQLKRIVAGAKETKAAVDAGGPAPAEVKATAATAKAAAADAATQDAATPRPGSSLANAVPIQAARGHSNFRAPATLPKIKAGGTSVTDQHHETLEAGVHGTREEATAALDEMIQKTPATHVEVRPLGQDQAKNAVKVPKQNLHTHLAGLTGSKHVWVGAEHPDQPGKVVGAMLQKRPALGGGGYKLAGPLVTADAQVPGGAFKQPTIGNRTSRKNEMEENRRESAARKAEEGRPGPETIAADPVVQRGQAAAAGVESAYAGHMAEQNRRARHDVSRDVTAGTKPRADDSAVDTDLFGAPAAAVRTPQRQPVESTPGARGGLPSGTVTTARELRGLSRGELRQRDATSHSFDLRAAERGLRAGAAGDRQAASAQPTLGDYANETGNKQVGQQFAKLGSISPERESQRYAPVSVRPRSEVVQETSDEFHRRQPVAGVTPGTIAKPGKAPQADEPPTPRENAPEFADKSYLPEPGNRVRHERRTRVRDLANLGLPHPDTVPPSERRGTPDELKKAGEWENAVKTIGEPIAAAESKGGLAKVELGSTGQPTQDIPGAVGGQRSTSASPRLSPAQEARGASARSDYTRTTMAAGQTGERGAAIADYNHYVHGRLSAIRGGADQPPPTTASSTQAYAQHSPVHAAIADEASGAAPAGTAARLLASRAGIEHNPNDSIETMRTKGAEAQNAHDAATQAVMTPVTASAAGTMSEGTSRGSGRYMSDAARGQVTTKTELSPEEADRITHDSQYRRRGADPQTAAELVAHDKEMAAHWAETYKYSESDELPVTGAREAEQRDQEEEDEGEMPQVKPEEERARSNVDVEQVGKEDESDETPVPTTAPAAQARGEERDPYANLFQPEPAMTATQRAAARTRQRLNLETARNLTPSPARAPRTVPAGRPPVVGVTGGSSAGPETRTPEEIEAARNPQPPAPLVRNPNLGWVQPTRGRQFAGR